MLQNLAKLPAAARAKIQPHIDGLIDDVKPLVQSIESGISTTRDNYGGYMSAFQRLGAADPVTILLVGCAMESAGGNVAGIDAAAAILSP